MRSDQKKTADFNGKSGTAVLGCAATVGGISAEGFGRARARTLPKLLFAIVFAFSCATPPEPAERAGQERAVRHRLELPSSRLPSAPESSVARQGPEWVAPQIEQCAWYGERIGERLIFGIADFWPAYWASGGRADADLAYHAPRWVGRFDLRERAFIAPLALDAPSSRNRSGTWDVLPLAATAASPLAASANSVAFTSLFEDSGALRPPSGPAERVSVTPLAEGRAGLSELAAGPRGTFLGLAVPTRGRRRRRRFLGLRHCKPRGARALPPALPSFAARGCNGRTAGRGLRRDPRWEDPWPTTQPRTPPGSPRIV